MSLLEDLSLVACYNCDGDTVDATGITGDGTAVGSTFTTPGKIFSQAILHDGIDDRMTIPTTGINNEGQAFSYGGWNNFTNGVGNFEHMMSSGASDAGHNLLFSTFIRRDTDGKIRAVIEKAQVWEAVLLSNNVLLPSVDTDYQSYVTYDGSKTLAGFKFYLNGSEITDRTASGAFGAASIPHEHWLIGSEESLAFDMAGKQNQMLLSNIEISAASISSLYNGGDGVDIFASPPNSRLLLLLGR